MSKETQEPSLGVHFKEVSTKRESIVFTNNAKRVLSLVVRHR